VAAKSVAVAASKAKKAARLHFHKNLSLCSRQQGFINNRARRAKWNSSRVCITTFLLQLPKGWREKEKKKKKLRIRAKYAYS